MTLTISYILNRAEYPNEYFVENIIPTTYYIPNQKQTCINQLRA